jgi:hypothetical protein
MHWRTDTRRDCVYEFMIYGKTIINFVRAKCLTNASANHELDPQADLLVLIVVVGLAIGLSSLSKQTVPGTHASESVSH